LKILRHDRREIRRVKADWSCEVDSAGSLHCLNRCARAPGAHGSCPKAWQIVPVQQRSKPRWNTASPIIAPQNCI